MHSFNLLYIRRSVDRCTRGCHHSHAYGCGNLDVNISDAWDFPNTDFLGKPDPYVIVMVVEDSGQAENTMHANHQQAKHL
jgi:hypothetical protein